MVRQVRKQGKDGPLCHSMSEMWTATGLGLVIAMPASGAILTAFYIWQRDLVACIVAHVVTNFAGIVVGPLVASGRVL